MNGVVAIHRRLVTSDKLNWWERSLFFLLIPLSVIYGGISWLRRFLYETGVLPSYRSSLPVISVGNIAAGGTGKTPTVDWLVKEFQQLGKYPAVVSRGYAGDFSGTVGVVSDGKNLLMSAEICGDEPYLLAKKNRSCPVVISKRRADGLRFLEQRGGIDVVILDDAFQHGAVKRDVDLVLLDARRPLGNGWPLPAGNLREFSGALKRADFLLLTRAENLSEQRFKDYPVYQSTHQLSDIAVDLNGRKTSVDTLKSLKLFAFSGIANPVGFFTSLENLDLFLAGKLPLGDHVEYDLPLLEKIKILAEDVDALITTEKDGVKLAADMFELPCYQVPVDVRITKSAELFENIVQKLWSR
jgi:tetraacyldisaccharide 4'-kinase